MTLNLRFGIALSLLRSSAAHTSINSTRHRLLTDRSRFASRDVAITAPYRSGIAAAETFAAA